MAGCPLDRPWARKRSNATQPPSLSARQSDQSTLSKRALRLQMQAANGEWFEVVDVKQKDSEIFSYLTIYIPPLITRDMSNPEVYVPLLILYSVIAISYFRLESPYLNPFFAIFKRRIYEGRIKKSRGMATIISHMRPLAGTDEVMLREIGNGDLYYCESA